MIIQHNIMALNAHRQLGGNNSLVSKNLEKLSSGFKINRAGDDAAGLAISEKMRAQITGLTRAQANAQDGISLVQTAEGALTEVHSMLNRMVDLATQSSNGTIKDDDRQKIQDEMNALTEEITRISKSTNFNGINLLDGSLGSGTSGASATVAADSTAKTGAFNWSISAEEGVEVEIKSVVKGTTDGVTASWAGDKLTLQIGGDDGDKITQSAIDAAIRAASGAPDKGDSLKVTLDNDIVFSDDSAAGVVSSLTSAAAKQATAVGKALTNKEGASTKVELSSTKAGVNTSILTVSNTGTSKIGATANADGSVALNLSATEGYTADKINAMLSEAGAEMSMDFDGTLTGAQLIAGDTGGGATYQLGTDGVAGAGLAAGGGLELQIGDTAEEFNKVNVQVDDMSASGLGIGNITVGTQGVSDDAIATIKAAINKVSTNRSAMGAMQNRLEHTINNLSVATENMTAAESRIRDVDMAKEMMHFTKNNVLSQAAQAMLAQANQQPQQVLQLLR